MTGSFWSNSLAAPYYVVPLLLVCPAAAYTVFNTHCSASTGVVNFVSSPDTRGTLDILWSCLLTIFACTWTLQHLNVPRQRQDWKSGLWADTKWKLKGVLDALKWMLYTVIAPELIFGIAVGEYHNARIVTKRLKNYARQDGVPWTTTHSYFANMGGYSIEYLAGDLHMEREARGRETNLADKEGYIIESGGDDQRPAPDTYAAADHPHPESETFMRKGMCGKPMIVHLYGSDIIQLRQKDILKEMPSLTENAIRDKSKTDGFAKAIAIGQILWMAIQIIARVGQHLPISQLELAVMAFSVNAVITYGFLWAKPKAIQVPVSLLYYPGPLPREVIDILDNDKWYFPQDLPERLCGSPIPNRYKSDMEVRLSVESGEEADYSVGSLEALVLGFIAFGALHIAAWHFAFPNHLEQILWRVASLISTFIPFAGFALMAISKKEWVWLWPPLVLYVVARIFLVVEAFRTLCFLPPEAYIATWATNIPHVS